MHSSIASELKPTIYLIDADQVILHGLSNKLSALDAQIKCFTSAESFLKEKINTHSACLLLEAHLPGLCGIDLMKCLLQQGHNIPTIMLSRKSDIPTAVRAMQAKAIDFIEKPYNEDALLEQVEKILQQH
ncbi:MAG: FixJ family two-component response regulator [Paraglaciecola sp.]|jgi:FixJ family two-component response regulator